MPKTFSFLDKPVEGPFAIGERPDGAHVRIKGAKFGADALASIDDVTPTKRVDSVLNPHNYSLSELYKEAAGVRPVKGKGNPIGNMLSHLFKGKPKPGTTTRIIIPNGNPPVTGGPIIIPNGNPPVTGGPILVPGAMQGAQTPPKTPHDASTFNMPYRHRSGVTTPPYNKAPTPPPTLGERIRGATDSAKRGFGKARDFTQANKGKIKGYAGAAGGTYLGGRAVLNVADRIASRGHTLPGVEPPQATGTTGEGEGDGTGDDQFLGGEEGIRKGLGNAWDHVKEYGPQYALAGGGIAGLMYLLKQQRNKRKKREREIELYGEPLEKEGAIDLDVFITESPLLAGFLTACGDRNLNELEIRRGLLKAAEVNPRLMDEFEKFAAPPVSQKPKVLPDNVQTTSVSNIPVPGTVPPPAQPSVPTTPVPGATSAADTAVDKTIPTTGPPQQSAAQPPAGAAPATQAAGNRAKAFPSVGDPFADDTPYTGSDPFAGEPPYTGGDPFADDPAAATANPAAQPAAQPAQPVAPNEAQPVPTAADASSFFSKWKNDAVEFVNTRKEEASQIVSGGVEILKQTFDEGKQMLDEGKKGLALDALQNDVLSVEQNEKSMQAIAAAKPDASQEEIVAIHEGMSTGEKVALWGGLSLAVVGIMSAMSGEGGIMSILLPLLGVAVAGGAAAHGGMFGGEAKGLARGGIGQLGEWLGMSEPQEGGSAWDRGTVDAAAPHAQAQFDEFVNQLGQRNQSSVDTLRQHAQTPEGADMIRQKVMARIAADPRGKMMSPEAQKMTADRVLGNFMKGASIRRLYVLSLAG